MQLSAGSDWRLIFSGETLLYSICACCLRIIHSMLKTPEQWLEVAAPQKKQPIFKLFVGYAPGVGKTFNMLSEGIRRHSRGEDVVIGVVETHGRAVIAELASKLETIPRRKI